MNTANQEPITAVACIPNPFISVKQIEWKYVEALKAALDRIISSFMGRDDLWSDGETTEESNADIINENMEWHLANDPKTSADVLDRLSMNPFVAEAVAANENTASTTLQRLAQHWSHKVRAAVSENRYVPFEVLSLLSQDVHPEVRFAVAENPYVPKTMLVNLLNDENPFVACRADTTLKRLEQECRQTNQRLY